MTILYHIVAVFTVLTCTCSTQPNIVFMLIDDLGWNDVSFHGSFQIPTPNIDTLAYNGIILDNYYVQPLCTPSRGSLMTGKYPIKLGLQHYVIGAGEPWGLSPDEILLPQRLKKLGYTTHGVGKWHLGSFKKSYLPTRRGFDSFFGFNEGKGDFFAHYNVDGKFGGHDFNENDVPTWSYFNQYSTDVFTEKAKNIIKNHNSSQPLFLYLPYQAVHAGNVYEPIQAPPEYIAQFSHIKDEKRRFFAAMVSALDNAVGEIFTALYENNMYDDTIIVFSTDNGGAVRDVDESSGSNWPLRGSKYTLWEGGVKGTAFISSPLIKDWGIRSSNLMHISDWLPTLYAAAGGNPQDLGEIDGYNFWPSLNGKASAPRDHILLNIDEQWNVEAIRKNQYKLIKGTVFNGALDGWYDKEGRKTLTENSVISEDMSIDKKVYEKKLQEAEISDIIYNRVEQGTCDTFKSQDYCEFSDIEEEIEIDSEEKIENMKEDIRKFHEYKRVKVIDCGIKPINASTNCVPSEYCLYDLENDPCEYINLAHVLKPVTEELKDLLNEYRKKAVPIRNKEQDPRANPKYHGYAWVPWVEE